jgi:hypothetical protein
MCRTIKLTTWSFWIILFYFESSINLVSVWKHRVWLQPQSTETCTPTVTAKWSLESDVLTSERYITGIFIFKKKRGQGLVIGTKIIVLSIKPNISSGMAATYSSLLVASNWLLCYLIEVHERTLVRNTRLGNKTDVKFRHRMQTYGGEAADCTNGGS